MRSTPPAVDDRGRDGAPTRTLVIGIAWLLCAATTAYLAWLQLSLADGLSRFSTDLQQISQLRLFAGVNVGCAAAALLLAVLVLVRPSRRWLDISAAWSLVALVLGLFQLGSGPSDETIVIAFLTAGVAGLLSVFTRMAYPRAGRVDPRRGVWSWAVVGLVVVAIVASASVALDMGRV